ncbi:hypothetical protein KAR91_24285, partial [Candidatus Pacearchaeota archaeon]|nr:hypothetical protein [Candidatus Pacearchaeota archaeon]
RLVNLFASANRRKTQKFPWDTKKPWHFGLIHHHTHDNIIKVLAKEVEIDLVSAVGYSSTTLKYLTEDKITLVSHKAAIEEIYAMMAAWEEVRFRTNILSVCVKDVTLSDHEEEVDLGDFWIHLNVTDPFHSLRIESVDEMCSSQGGYHPHVKNEKLCRGDGGDIMNAALCEGRLEDYFTIVESILRTYNNDSPYYHLNDWYDSDSQDSCIVCAEPCSEAQIYTCYKCENVYCENCFNGGSCEGCNELFCQDCCKTCEECDTVHCEVCLTTCPECNNSVCQSCTNLCITCEHDHCDSCSSPCTNCGDNICSDCKTECGSCTDSFCDDCITEKCTQCSAGICEGCKNECEECNKLVCDSCYDNVCEHCGTSTCTSCSKNHQCILAEIDN